MISRKIFQYFSLAVCQDCQRFLSENIAAFYCKCLLLRTLSGISQKISQPYTRQTQMPSAQNKPGRMLMVQPDWNFQSCIRQLATRRRLKNFKPKSAFQGLHRAVVLYPRLPRRTSLGAKMTLDCSRNPCVGSHQERRTGCRRLVKPTCAGLSRKMGHHIYFDSRFPTFVA